MTVSIMAGSGGGGVVTLVGEVWSFWWGRCGHSDGGGVGDWVA